MSSDPGNNPSDPVKKKRGRKPKTVDAAQVTVPKKRGRKPKGGKIVDGGQIPAIQEETRQNIILHLKCSLSDLNHSEHYANDTVVEPFSLHPTGLQFHVIDKASDHVPPAASTACSAPFGMECDITSKLKELSHCLHHNELPDTRSDCFWCTCPYDNPPIYIPKNRFNDSYQVYGSFCCPECAAGYLFRENLDSSTKFERYQLLNYLYGKTYNYNKNIIPAPSPFYLLNKFYGTLTIQEYRQLLRKDQIILVIDKPLTKTTPEIFNENNEFSIKCLRGTGSKSDQYRLCRKTPSSKVSSLTDNFRISDP